MVGRVKTAHQLAQRVALDPSLQKEIQENPVKTLADLAEPPPPPPLQWDVWIYRIVVSSLGMVVLIAITGAIVLAVLGIKEIPDVITALGSAAVGALAGLLAPVPIRKEPVGGGQEA